MCCVATMVVQIPLPTGYVNIGDCFVIISGFLLGPVYGGFAAAASIPGNLVQAGVGVVTAYIFSLMIDKVHIADLINQ